MKNVDHRDEVAFEVEHDASECDVSEAALAQPFGLGALLREEAGAELEKRDGEWDAFTASVFRRVDNEDLALERMSLEDRAIGLMKVEVEGELGEMMPRFDREFRNEVEQRIWRAAREKPAMGERVSTWLSSFREKLFPRTLGFAAAAAAAALLFAVWPSSSEVTPLAIAPEGSVSVERVQFEGTVTVMEEGGMTVVWLADNVAS